MVAAYGYWWYRRRFGSEFNHLVDQFNERERWSREMFHSYQEEQLAAVLVAARQSPYYRRILDEANVSNHTPPFEALARLPVLTKETLRAHADDLLTARPPRGTLSFKSSGTTGTPTKIYYTREFHALELAVPESRSLRWAGVTHRARRVMFGVRKVCRFDQTKPPFWRVSPAERLAYASVYHLSPEFLPAYLRFLRRFEPSIVMGYPSALHTIARYALDVGDMPAAADVVITTSETVSEQARLAIEAAWRCQLYDRYGAVEGCVFASQCEYGRYHVSPEVGIIEIVDHSGRCVPPGVTGELICTGLQNRLQPLIRYKIGDIGRWAEDQSCRCHRQMPILDGIEGRWEDLCYTPDGRQMLRFDTVFKGITTIREAQVVQQSLDCFAILVVPDTDFSQADVARIAHNMRQHVGDVRTKVECVARIPRTGAGKFRAVVCNLSAEEKAVFV
jgi:phenylacetate-CoA ligase